MTDQPNRHALIFLKDVSVAYLIDWLQTLPPEANHGIIMASDSDLKISWIQEEEDKT